MKRALVAGSSGAIGAAICRALGRTVLHVVVHAHRNPEKAADLAEAIRCEGGR